MAQAPILTLSDFSKTFTIETDACQTGIGAMLMQDRKSIAFLSKKLGVKNQGLSTYKKELLALLTVVTKWRHYLIGNQFVIKTDQISLKNLLKQRIHTAMQHKGLSKLLELDYTVEYKNGIKNKVADALSRKEGQNGICAVLFADLAAVTELVPQWVSNIQSSYKDDERIASLVQRLQDTPSSSTLDISNKLTQHRGIPRWKGRICVGNQDD